MPRQSKRDVEFELRVEVQNRQQLQAIIREGVAAVEHATETLATTTPQVEQWLAKAKEALS